MSGSELNMERQNHLIRLRQLFENGEIILPSRDIVEAIQKLNEEQEAQCREEAENPRHVPGGGSG